MKVFITGSTGSLGRALIERFLTLGAERIVGLNRNELNYAALYQHYKAEPRVRVFMGDVRDRERVTEAMYGCDTVICAAALKRVDDGCDHPWEICQTNVVGVYNTIRAAVEVGAKRVVLISSDKAVSASNVYGASKFLAEQLAIRENALCWPRGTEISVTRYGNVIGSNGSVIPTWRAQVAAGKPLTITDPRMTRFWLPMNEAVDLVLKALDLMHGGEIFIPVLPSMRLLDLAEAMAPGYPREIIGLRPGGEKLAEALISPEEVWRSRRLNDLIVVTPSNSTWTTYRWPGTPLPESFVYESDKNDRIVSVEQMREWLKTL